MSDAAHAPHAATEAQNGAARPDASAWVAANAGSGKTRVLTQRVARLLLARCPPQKILCLTYTRAAAAEMQTRLFDMLGGWAMLDDRALAEALAELGEPGAPDADRLAEARRLFAAALETPGGLKIQTIHAFCAALLRRFPLEAGAPPGFSELDDRSAARILEALREEAALAAETGEDPAFDHVAARAADETLDGALHAIAAARRRFAPGMAEALPERFGLDLQAELGTLMRDALGAPWAEALEPLRAALAGSGANDQARAAALAAAMEAMRRDDWEAAGRKLEEFGLTGTGAPRSTRSFPANAAKALLPDALARTEALIEAAQAARALRLDHGALHASLDLHALAARVLAGYAAEKAARGALDFEDLIERATALLSESSAAAWALWRLDGGIDHILVDEAQDTSPDQWRVIEALTGEFFAGAGARPRPRTVFAVGDEKQSIYSFQGADPGEFSAMRERFSGKAEAAQGEEAGAAAPFKQHALLHSFRSAPAVLRLVDRVFAYDNEGLSADGAAPRHLAFHQAAPGLVELWPPLPRREDAPEPPWFEPVDAAAPEAPHVRLAEAVAAHLDDLIREGTPIPDRGAPGGWRPMRPGDVMILLRRRGRLAPLLISRLKGRGLDVAGADRLDLLQSLAARDCLSLLRATLDREDDLAAAEVLRSPFGGLSEGELEDLAVTRVDEPLLEALARRAEAFPAPATLFADLQRNADFERPFELLQRALVRHDGRAKLRARVSMGPEEEEAVDALLAQCLAYESAETPTLPGFLDWMAAGESLELKRDMAEAGDAIRVMTVHGAKGLEAPMVVLPDTGPPRAPSPALLTDPQTGAALWKAPGLGEAGPLADAQAAAQAREEEETRRLLYVALTRAESRLLICGYGDDTKDSWTGCWHDAATGGMASAEAVETAPPTALAGEEIDAVLRLADGWTPPQAMGPALEAAEPPPPAAVPAPGSARPDAPRPPRADRRRAASALGGDGAAPARAETAEGGAAPLDRDLARRRGDAVHLLLDHLPAAPPPSRREAGARMLAALRPPLAPEVLQGALEEALAALEDPAVADFLGPDALSEAPVSHAPAPGLRVSGRIDRLIAEPDRVRLLDWKTGPAPEATPEPYLHQMAAYRDALTKLHPGAEIEASLYWTGARRLDRLPAEALDAALARWLAEEAGAA
ncbi:MAG: double-strand break repair helicase AddA [Pseudomonadota bacterium]